MRTLYHMVLSPHSRKVRLVLGEKELAFELRAEKTWERREGFLKLNPAGDVPVLVEEDSRYYCDSTAISEYLDEAYPEPPLLGNDVDDRAEIRRLVAWFDNKFHHEAGGPLINERLMKRFLGLGEPQANVIRSASRNLRNHLDYVSYLSERRNYLADGVLSLADLSAAAHLSVADYLGHIDWSAYPRVKDWYVKVKSRKSFRSLLEDRVPGLEPPKHYGELDF
jgi:glutathione S-transferase